MRESLHALQIQGLLLANAHLLMRQHLLSAVTLKALGPWHGSSWPLQRCLATGYSVLSRGTWQELSRYKYASLYMDPHCQTTLPDTSGRFTQFTEPTKAAN